jgi:hypothetical protein
VAPKTRDGESTHVQVEQPIALDQATLTLDALLNEDGGAGELIHGPAGTLLVPLRLQPPRTRDTGGGN